MIVYKYLTNEEIYSILYKMKYQIGQTPTELQLASSRKYKRDVKYLHFFKDIEDLEIVQSIDKSPRGMVVGKFDIPSEFLIEGYGVAQYTGTPIENTDKFIVMKEFAVDVQDIKSDMLINYVLDKNCDISIDEVKQEFSVKEKEPNED